MLCDVELDDWLSDEEWDSEDGDDVSWWERCGDQLPDENMEQCDRKSCSQQCRSGPTTCPYSIYRSVSGGQWVGM